MFCPLGRALNQRHGETRAGHRRETQSQCTIDTLGVPRRVVRAAGRLTCDSRLGVLERPGHVVVRRLCAVLADMPFDLQELQPLLEQSNKRPVRHIALHGRGAREQALMAKRKGRVPEPRLLQVPVHEEVDLVRAQRHCFRLWEIDLARPGAVAPAVECVRMCAAVRAALHETPSRRPTDAGATAGACSAGGAWPVRKGAPFRRSVAPGLAVRAAARLPAASDWQPCAPPAL